MKITLIGIGLMNGSLSKDIRKIYPNCFIQGFSRNDSTIETAIKLGLIQKKCNINQISDSDFIFISIPVEAIEQKLSEVLNNISKKTLVIDFGSTKNSICMSVKNHPNRSNYLAAHPIACLLYTSPSPRDV